MVQKPLPSLGLLLSQDHAISSGVASLLIYASLLI